MKLALAALLVAGSVGLGLLLMHQAYVRGYIRSRYGEIHRAEKPVLFAVVTSISALVIVAGTGAVVAILVGLLLD